MYMKLLKWLSKIFPCIKIPCGTHITTLPTDLTDKDKTES